MVLKVSLPDSEDPHNINLKVCRSFKSSNFNFKKVSIITGQGRSSFNSICMWYNVSSMHQQEPSKLMLLQYILRHYWSLLLSEKNHQNDWHLIHSIFVIIIQTTVYYISFFDNILLF